MSRGGGVETARYSGHLPTMPRAAHRALDLLGDPDVSSEQLRQIIEPDQSLTAAVLRLANSALFGFLQPITTLSHAITLIGLARLRSLIMASIMAGMRDRIPEGAAAEATLIWEHSISTALGARIIAAQAGMDRVEEAFVAGLMHDCGRIVLLTERTAPYLEAIEAADGRLPTPDEERARLGFCHQQVGAELLESWRLAPQYVAATAGHHGHLSGAGPHARLVAAVALADRLPDPRRREDPSSPIAILGLGGRDLAALASDLRSGISEGLGALRGI